MTAFQELIEALQRERRWIARAKIRTLIRQHKTPTGHPIRITAPTPVIRRSEKETGTR